MYCFAVTLITTVTHEYCVCGKSTRPFESRTCSNWLRNYCRMFVEECKNFSCFKCKCSVDTVKYLDGASLNVLSIKKSQTHSQSITHDWSIINIWCSANSMLHYLFPGSHPSREELHDFGSVRPSFENKTVHVCKNVAYEWHLHWNPMCFQQTHYYICVV